MKTLLPILLIAFALHSCENKQETHRISVSENDKQNQNNNKIKINNKEYSDFDLFYIALKKSLNNKEELAFHCQFPFNEEITKNEFLKEQPISDEAKLLIQNATPEKSGNNFVIDNDAYFITFSKNQSGNWKLKSVHNSY